MTNALKHDNPNVSGLVAMIEPLRVSIDPEMALVEDAIARIAAGELVLVSDSADREDEADLTMAAQWVTAQKIAFMMNHGKGLVCMPSAGSRLDDLRIPMMVDSPTGDTNFTVSIDHRSVGSGISASDRANTIRRVLDPEAHAEDFIRPGHIFPLRAQEGGVLVRAGHTEASVDLARLAGLPPVAVICEVMNQNGEPARGAELEALASEHGLGRVAIDSLIKYRKRLINQPC